jgi:hypothetical protein
LVEVAIKFPRIFGRKRREKDNIQRLETVGCMRGKDGEEDLVAVAKIYKIAGYMAAVAVEDEKSVSSSRFLLREALKDLFEPGHPKLVVTPSLG